MTSNYSTIEVKEKETEYKDNTSHSIYLGFVLHYITLRPTNYLYCKRHIQMTSNHNTHMWRKKTTW